MKKLVITGGYVLLDDWMFPILKDIPWWTHHSGYAITKIKGKHIAMHRLIMLAPQGLCVDHINRNRQDNRFSNLRLCLKQVNACNASIQHNNTTGYKGVHYHKKNSCYVAYIGRKPRVYLGSFKNKKDAAKAYNKAAIERFGVFANLNVI